MTPTAHGFEGELWTLERVAEVIQRLTGVRHHRRTCGRCCATEWAGRCSAPAAARCYGPGGGGAQLCFHLQSGNYTERLIVVLGELRRLLGGQKATLLEELLPAACTAPISTPTTASSAITAASKRGCDRCGGSSRTAAPG
jgi:hypothetical protein